jgi:lipoprotein signal peptidase
MTENITQIPSSKVPVLQQDTGLMSTQWYRFFFNIYILTNNGVSGSFTTADGKTVTVTNGIITAIV